MTKMADEEYEATQQQVLLLGSLVRGLPLGPFIERAQRALDVGPLTAPSHWMAGNEKLELILALARKLLAVQAALPSEEEARSLDTRADAARERLGI